MTDFPKTVTAKLKKLPNSPGVYKFFDSDEGLLYVGKAKVLKNRVRSYFQKSTNHSPKTKKLVGKVAGIDWIETKTEAEALALEANLVHNLKPPFNILLRDDKHFLYLRISKEPFPRVEFTRKFERDGSTYFGPYVKAKDIRKTVEFLREVLQFRTCKVDISPEGKTIRNPENRKIPCLDHQIHRCTAPCNEHIDREKYAEDIRELVEFLRGKSGSIKKRVQKEMMTAAESKEFERAARFRDLFQSIQRVDQQQIASVASDFSADIIGTAFGKKKSFFHVLYVREGKILRSENFALESAEEEKETMSAFLREHMTISSEIPPLVVIPFAFETEEQELWEEFAEELAGRKTEIRLPERGVKKQLLEMATKNAVVQAANDRASFEDVDVLLALQKSLDLPRRPERIECYDISHLGGTHAVGSRVVFLGGEPAKSEYRKYKIRDLESGQIDDFAAMAEVLGRRLKHLQTSDANLKMRKVTKKTEKERVQKEVKGPGIKEVKTQWEFLKADSREVIGYAHLQMRGKQAEIGGILVKEEFRGHGFGTEIVRMIVEKSEEKVLRVLPCHKKLKWQVSIKSLGFAEEKKPPKSFEKIIEERGKKEGKIDCFKISPDDFRKVRNQIPDLLVIDGGKGQLSAVVQVLKKLRLLEKIPVCSLAKREEEIFVPGKSQPLPISKNSEENKLLQRIRDEAHRFAVGFNRQLRDKAMLE